MSDTLEQAMLESELALADETLITPVNEYLLIDPETRLIEVPESESLFGVYSENDVEVKHFACPRIVLNNIDLSQMYIFINYVSASGKYGQTLAKNIKTSEDGNYITFDWELTGNVFDSNTNGKIYFAVMAKKQMEDKNPVFATRKASGDYYETIEAGEVIQEQHADIILEMLTRIEALENGGTGGSSFSGKASDVSYDDTETKLGAENVQDAIDKLSEDCDLLIQMDFNIGNSGLEEDITPEHFTILKGNALEVIEKYRNKEVVKIYLLSRWYYEDEGWSYDLYPVKTVEIDLSDDESEMWSFSVYFTDDFGNSVYIYFSEDGAISRVEGHVSYILRSKYVTWRQEGKFAMVGEDGYIEFVDLPTGGSGSDWDMLIKTTNFTSDAENYTVVKGDATDIFTRCKAGEQLKVGLLIESDYEDPTSKIMSAESVNAVGELGVYSWLEFVFGYNDGENENAWYINLNTGSITNNTVYAAKHTYLYGKRIVKHPTNELGSPQFGEVGQFAVSDGNGGITWLTVNNGNEVAY